MQQHAIALGLHDIALGLTCHALQDHGGEEISSLPQGEVPVKQVRRTAPPSEPHCLSCFHVQDCGDEEKEVMNLCSTVDVSNVCMY
jgi:hypothetical protein